MAFDIPLPMSPDRSLAQGIQQGTDLFKYLMQNKLAQQQEQRAQQLMPWQKQLLQAQAQQAQAKAIQANMMAQLLGGSPQQSEQQSQPQTPQPQYPALQEMFHGQGMLQPDMMGQEQQSQPQTPQEQTQVPSEIIYQGNPQLHGVDKIAQVMNPQAIQSHYDSDGNLIRVYPSGKIERQRVGLSEQEKAIASARGKYVGESYGHALDTMDSLHGIGQNLDYLQNIVDSNPNAKNVIGPINKWLGTYVGTPEEQAAIGMLKTGTGNILLDSAKNIKGAFTGRDQTMINDMKPNVGDPYYVFRGKLKAFKALNEAAQKRLEIYADLLDKGVAPHKAIKQANEQTDFQSIYDQGQKEVRIAQLTEQLREGKVPKFTSKNEASEFLNTLPAVDKMKLMQLVGGK